jgi:hypothetical protein
MKMSIHSQDQRKHRNSQIHRQENQTNNQSRIKESRIIPNQSVGKVLRVSRLSKNPVSEI